MLLTERARYWGILLGVTILLLVWYLPGTVALRNLTIAVLLLLSLPSWRDIPWKGLRPAWGLLMALSVWMLVQWLGWAFQPDIVIRELKGEWLKALLTALLGLLLASVKRKDGQAMVSPRMIFLIGLSLPAAFAISSLWLYWLYERWLVYPLWISHRTGVSFWTNIQLGLLMADTLAQLSGRPSALRLPVWARVSAFGLLLLTSYVTVTRNGHVATLLICLVGLVIGVWQSTKGIRRLGMFMAGGIALAGLAWNMFHADTRWLKFVDTLPVAWDTEHHKAWIDGVRYPYPLLPGSNQIIEPSAYERLAWAKEAAISVARFPMGVGYDRNAFRRALHVRFPNEPRLPGHSHSGMMDMAIGAGIPGLLLWLAWGTCMIAYGLRLYLRERQSAGLMLAFVVSGFFARSVLDSNVRDHMLEHFMFLSAYLLAWAYAARSTASGGKL